MDDYKDWLKNERTTPDNQVDIPTGSIANDPNVIKNAFPTYKAKLGRPTMPSMIDSIKKSRPFSGGAMISRPKTL